MRSGAARPLASATGARSSSARSRSSSTTTGRCSRRRSRTRRSSRSRRFCSWRSASSRCVVGPETISSLMAHFSHVMPAQATSLLGGSLHRLDQHPSTGIAMTVVGFVLAIWSTTGAMTTYMTALNLAYERKDRRSFVRKRLVALEMVGGDRRRVPARRRPAHLRPAGSSSSSRPTPARSPGAVGWIWWIAEWPILLAGPAGRVLDPPLPRAGRRRIRAGGSSRPARSSRPSSGSPPRAPSPSTRRCSAPTTRRGDRSLR